MDETDYMWFNDEMIFDDEIYKQRVYEELEIMENKKLFMIYLSQHNNEASTSQGSNEQGTNIVKHLYKFTGNLYEALEENNDMPEHSNKPPCDSYEMPSCETIRTDTSKVLLNMSDMMTQMMKMMQEISKVLPSRKEDMPNAQNSGHENPYIRNDHDENYDEI
ncbi:hypothetical protein J1N35_043532 [Gossypium stocksii]|uniref:Uncharacterized protein n=1 Tax=Gossypium stocksii TaxID=47602 RepID=A0A9D3ZFL0_9ROSI|nr:hypothetical protein J1N35_043532 [Gossypium stocksii]